jgi:hypothetical protein
VLTFGRVLGWRFDDGVNPSIQYILGRALPEAQITWCSASAMR